MDDMERIKDKEQALDAENVKDVVKLFQMQVVVCTKIMMIGIFLHNYPIILSLFLAQLCVKSTL